MQSKSPLALIAILCLCFSLSSAASDRLEIGDQAPVLGLEALLQAPPGAATDWAALEGRLVVLDFWGTWCKPCLVDIPRMNSLADAFAGRPVQFVSVTDEPAAVVEPFLKEKPMHAWVGLDTDRSVFDSYRISGLPVTVLVGGDARVLAVTSPRQLTAEILEAALAGRPLGAPSPEPPNLERLPPLGGTMEPPLFHVSIRRAAQGGRPTEAVENGFLSAERITLGAVLSLAHEIKQSRIRTDFLTSGERYDVSVYPGGGDDDAWRGFLRQALEATFGIRARRETREVDVLVLSAPNGSSSLKPGTPPAKMNTGGGRLRMRDTDLAGLVHLLEISTRLIVVDETGIEGTYDCELTWEMTEPETIHDAVSRQSGLQLEPGRREVEFLIVERPSAAAGPGEN